MSDPVTATVDEATFDGYQFCGVAEQFTAESAICYWPEKTVTWHVRDPLPRLSINDMKAAYQLAASAWESVCGIDLVYSSNPKTANILITAADLGGPSGVLGDSYLPKCGIVKNSQYQVLQRYDVSERWLVAEKPPAGSLDIARVFAHELGHGLFCPHTNDGGLMDPTYSSKVRWPSGKRETELAVKGYGPPLATPPPTPGGEKIIRVRPDGGISVDGYRLTKIGG